MTRFHRDLKEATMTRKLILIILGCVLLSFVLATICHLAFPDILPYAAGEDAASSWRRQIAFFITASAWLSAEVAVIFSIALASRLWKRYSLNKA
jgi:CBS domain containing-hemolysin-like protein